MKIKKLTQWIYYGRDTATKAFTWPWSGGGWANLLPSTSNGQNFGWEITSNFVPAQSGTYSFEISSDDNEATCTISTDADTMQSIMDGSSSPQAAFMTGKLKVAGDMSIALKVQSVIS